MELNGSGGRIREDGLIGFVASGSRASWCYVLLVEGREDIVAEETFAYVLDRGDVVLGVLRSGQGLDENLKIGAYGPGVAYAKKGFAPSSSRRSFTYVFSVIGRVEGGELRENRLILTPGSPVHICIENPFLNIRGNYVYSARHWEKPWRIPFDPRGIPMHIGIVGSTGSGKSFLARHVIIPLMNSVGYAVLAFDWHGCDYAPYAGDGGRVSISDVRLNGSVAAAHIAEKASFFGFRSGENEICRALQAVLEESDDWRGLSLPEFRAWVEKKLSSVIDEKKWGRLSPAFQRGLSKISDGDWGKILGRLDPAEIIEAARLRGFLAVDMSGFREAEKLSTFLSIAEEIKRRIDGGEKMNLCLLIDEAPQYCPYKTEGLQEEVKDLIRDLAATGRKHNLSLILVSQGLAGEIGVDAAVRRNLNTHFIGRIMPQDRREVEDMLGAYHISYESLLRLQPGQFYFEGRMNPFPTPLLISFDL